MAMLRFCMCQIQNTCSLQINQYNLYFFFQDINQFLTRCEDCGNKVKPSSLITHKMKNCQGMNYIDNDSDITINNKVS